MIDEPTMNTLLTTSAICSTRLECEGICVMVNKIMHVPAFSLSNVPDAKSFDDLDVDIFVPGHFSLFDSYFVDREEIESAAEPRHV